jgi:Mg/Co/Ni transporter MgtE
MDPATRIALEDEVFQLTGARRVEHEESNILLAAVASRGPWLLPCILVGLVSLTLPGLYAGKPQRLPETLLFIAPLLLLTDSVARQSVGLMLRILRGVPWPLHAARRQLGNELLVGLCLGMAGGLLLAGIALAWPGSWRLASSVMLAAISGSAAAAAMGLFAPALVRVVFDRPWIAAGPLTRIPSAVVTLLLFVLLARMLIG